MSGFLDKIVNLSAKRLAQEMQLSFVELINSWLTGSEDILLRVNIKLWLLWNLFSLRAVIFK